MKRGYIAVILIVLSLIIGGVEYVYVTGTTDALLALLDEADAHMEQNEVYQAHSVAERLDYRFTNSSETLKIFAYHSEVGNISGEIAALRRYAQTGSAAEFLATSAKLKRDISSVKYSKQLKLENIL